MGHICCRIHYGVGMDSECYCFPNRQLFLITLQRSKWHKCHKSCKVLRNSIRFRVSKYFCFTANIQFLISEREQHKQYSPIGRYNYLLELIVSTPSIYKPTFFSNNTYFSLHIMCCKTLLNASAKLQISITFVSDICRVRFRYLSCGFQMSVLNVPISKHIFVIKLMRCFQNKIKMTIKLKSLSLQYELQTQRFE